MVLDGYVSINTRAKGAFWDDYQRKPTPPLKERMIVDIRKYLKRHSPEDLQKIVNDLIAENVIDK